jgi:tRNA A-37 threonylcarbamoyl transferase component Bud32
VSRPVLDSADSVTRLRAGGLIGRGGPLAKRTKMRQTRQSQSTETEATNRVTRSSAHRCDIGHDFTAIAVGEIEKNELAAFVSSPENVLSDPNASVIKRGRSALVLRLNFAIGGIEMPVAYKQCGSRTPLRRLVRGVRASAALRNFRLGDQFLNLGIHTPRPLLAVSPRWHKLLSPSYLATEWIDGAMPLDAFAQTASALAPTRRRLALRETALRLGQLIGTLHKRGYSHRDLKSANLLVRQKDGQFEVFLVDLDGASRLRLRLEATRLKNLARLQQATSRTPVVTRTLRCHFLQSYLATLGSPADWKTVWRQLRRISKIPPRPRPVAGPVDATPFQADVFMHADWAIERTAEPFVPDGWTRRREIHTIRKALSRVPSGSRVLTMPCRAGRCFELLMQRGFRVTCADSSESALQCASRRWEKLAEHTNSNALEPSFVLTECLQTNFPEGHFDAVICTGFFDRLDTSERRIEALKELRRISRGPVVVSFCNAFALGSLQLGLTRTRSANASRRRIPVPVWAFLNDIRRAGLKPVARHSVLWGISPLWHIVSVPASGHANGLFASPRTGVTKAA